MAPAIDTAALRAAAEAAAKDWYVAHDTFQVYANPKAILALLDRLAAAEAETNEIVEAYANHKKTRGEIEAERDDLQARLEAAEKERDEAVFLRDLANAAVTKRDAALAAAQERIGALGLVLGTAERALEPFQSGGWGAIKAKLCAAGSSASAKQITEWQTVVDAAIAEIRAAARALGKEEGKRYS